MKHDVRLPFRDRSEAGRLLARHLAHLKDESNLVLLGLPRGGVPVAFEISCFLGAPMDVFIVRKLGMPGHEELAIGAVASGSDPVLNPDLVGGIGADDESIAALVAREQKGNRAPGASLQAERPRRARQRQDNCSC